MVEVIFTCVFIYAMIGMFTGIYCGFEKDFSGGESFGVAFIWPLLIVTGICSAWKRILNDDR